LYLFWIYFKSILIPAAMAGSSNCSHLQKRQQCLGSYQPICIHNSFPSFPRYLNLLCVIIFLTIWTLN
jgi:hypothetical protein